MILLQYWTELDFFSFFFFANTIEYEKGDILSFLEKVCTEHCVLCSVCICISKLVCITSVIKLLFFHHSSEIAFHTQCNLWIGPVSESFQGCCSSLTTTFNIKYCAVCYVHLVQMEHCLLRWKSRMQYQNTFKCNNVSRICLFCGTDITVLLPLSLLWLLELCDIREFQ